MLRSAGYFSGVECPSVGQNEKCRRPYCPFRHKTSTKRAALGTSVEKSASQNTDAVNKAIEQIKSDIATIQDDYNPLLNESYEPEPYTPFNVKSSYSPAKQDYHPSKGTKSVLHAARGASNVVSPRKPRSKNIYKSKIHPGPKTDMEYDPVINYSTSTSKRVHSLGDDATIPEKKSKLTEVEGDIHGDLGTSEDDEEESNFIIDEEGDGTEEDIAETSGTDFDSDNASFADVVSGEKKDNDFAISAVIEILSDDDIEVRKNDKKVIDLTDDLEDNEGTKVAKDKKCESKSNVEKKQRDKGKIAVAKKVSKSSSTKEPKINSSHLNKKRKTRTGMKTKNIKQKTNTGAKISTGKKKNGTITAKDIDVSDIVNFVDRDEIKKLETELENGDTYQECLRIYQEGANRSSESYDSSASDQHEPIITEESAPTTNQVVVGKRRVAHAKAASVATSLHKPIIPKKRFSTPAQMMMKRLEIIEQERTNMGQSSSRVAHKVSDRMASLTKGTPKGHPIVRTNLAKLEKKIQENPWFPGNTNEPTVCGTATKGVTRVAHHIKEAVTVKNGSVIPPRPRIAVDRFSKVPNNIRQRYLSIFIDECLRIFCNDHEKAYKMAQTEEEQCKKRSSGKNIYLSLAASTLKRLRGMPTTQKTSTTESSDVGIPPSKMRKVRNGSVVRREKMTMSHGRLLDTNTKKCKGGYTIEKKEEKTDLKPEELYERMCRYIMTPNQLDENGYPRPCNVPGKAEFRKDPPVKPFNNTNKKICSHCGKEFMLDKKGNFAREDECTHHWGRAYMTRVGRGWEKRYTCCQEREGVEGCTIGDTHVHADNKLDRSGYVRTLSKSPPPDGNSGIFTLDCEMSYTICGLELTRVSVLDHNCKGVYETFVKPSGRVLDYNTRWSGITEESLKNVKTTIRDVQAAFLTKFSADTILMGHSLESDLIALKIIHETVIDTSIVFPHKRGPPYKRSLRNVASENIGLVIQNMASEGHDSAEDAAACMKLMLWKLAEDDKVSHK